MLVEQRELRIDVGLDGKLMQDAAPSNARL